MSVALPRFPEYGPASQPLRYFGALAGLSGPRTQATGGMAQVVEPSRPIRLERLRRRRRAKLQQPQVRRRDVCTSECTRRAKKPRSADQGNQVGRGFLSEPPVRIEPTTYSLRVKGSHLEIELELVWIFHRRDLLLTGRAHARDRELWSAPVHDSGTALRPSLLLQDPPVDEVCNQS